MRLVSSFLPKAAIEVAVCSKYCLETIVLTFRKLLVVSWFFSVSIVSCSKLLLWEILYSGKNA
jgi:hypothetical protein